MRAALVPGISTAAGIFRVSRTPAVLSPGPVALGGESARGQRIRGRAAAQSRGAVAGRRDIGGAVQAVLHAGDQSHREARGSHPPRWRPARIPDHRRPDAPARLRDSRGHRGGRLCGRAPNPKRCSILSTPATRPPGTAGTRRSSCCGGNRGCCRRASARPDRDPATSAAKYSYRWSMPTRRRIRANCASSP